MADEEVQVRITGDASGAQQAMSQASQAVSGGVDDMQESFEGVGGVLDEISEKFSTAFKVTGIAAAVEGLKLLGGEIEELATRAVKMGTLSDVLGVTVEEFQAMSVAADAVGVSDETFARAGERMVALLYKARDGSGAAIEKLEALGVTTAQIASPAFNLNALLETLHGRLTDSATAQSTMNALIAELGPRAALAAEAIKAYDGSAAGVAAVMDRLNGLSRDQTTELTHELSAFKELGTYVENTFTKAWLGAINATSELFTILATPPAPSPALAGLFGGSSGGGDTSGMQAAAQKTQETLQEVLVTAHAVTLGEVANAKELIETYRQGSSERLAAVQEYYNLAVQYYGSAEVDKVREAHKELLSEQRAYNQEEAALANEMSKVYEEVDHKVVESSLKAFKEIEASAASSAQQQEESQVGAIDREIKAVQEAAKEHQISAKKELEETQQLLQEKWQLQQQYFAQLASLYAEDPAKLDQINKQQETAHQKYLNEMQKAELTYSQQVSQIWTQLGKSMETSISSNFAKVLEGTESLGAAMRSVFSTAIDGIIQGFVKLGVAWVENTIIGEIQGKESALSQVTANASVAATGAMASVASIPVVGWAMAPEVGAATYAEAMGYEGSVSAASGYDIPSGVNPKTQLHEREMVLPQHLADAVRTMAATGGGRAPTVKFPGVSSGGFFITSLSDLKNGVNQLVRSHYGRAGAF
jgi:hypothetical protein